MRNSVTQALDSPQSFVGDAGFIGVNMRLDPSMLQPGYVSEARNARFRNGIAESRLGFVKMPWLNKITTGTITISSITRVSQTATATTASNHSLATNSIAVITGAVQAEYNGSFIITVTGPTTFTYTVTGAPATPATGSPVLNTYTIQPWGNVRGIGNFKDPYTNLDFVIIAADGNVYYTVEHNVPQTLGLPSGVSINGDVTFTQAYDHMIMFRGVDKPELELPRISTGFQEIVQTQAGDGTAIIPPAVRGEFFQNRLFIPNTNDQIAVSDFGDYTRYQPVVQELKVNVGSSDSIVNIAKFNDTTIIVFKDRSIYALSNIYGNLSAAVQDQITDQFGLAAAESVAHCGSDLLFLSQMGVMSLRQTEQNKIQSVTLPLSDPIQPLINRINWKYSSGAQAAYWDSKYYLAVPLDDAELIGSEYVATTITQHLGSFLVSPLTVGKMYRYIQGNSTSITHNATTYAYTVDFVATATTATINGIPINEAITASVREVVKGVNNAVLVYDFLNQAWSGYDQADGLTVKKFFVSKYRNTDRLFFVSNTGWIYLYEEDYDDAVPEPYLDVEVADGAVFTYPDLSNLSVNGGTTINAFGFGINDAATNHWGTNTVANARINLYTDTTLGAGYYPGGSPAWTAPLAPNTHVTQITNGVRFYATNGIPPVVSVTGSWSTITTTVVQPVLTTIVTRGYTPDSGVDLSAFDWLVFDAQTWNPDYSVTLLMDGVAEERTVSSSITKSRSRYTVFGRANYDITNANLDHATDYREDYSVLLGTGTNHAASFLLNSSSADISLHQQFREEFKVRQRGRSARVKFVTSKGRLRLTSVKLENRKLQTKAGSKL